MRLLLVLLCLGGLGYGQTFGGGGGSSGATSVGLSMPASFCSVTNSPVTTSAVLTCTYATGQTINRIFATDVSGNVGLFAMTTAMLPSIAASNLSNGVTGSGSVVLGTSPTLVTPALGTPSALVLTNATGLPNAGLLNSSMTIAGHSVSLGGTQTIASTDLSDTSSVTRTIASGTSAFGTSAISSGTCASVVTTSATGTATTDVITATFNADPTAVTGYSPTTNGMLTIIGYPTSNNVNWKVCNNTSASITPGAITLNWRVAR